MEWGWNQLFSDWSIISAYFPFACIYGWLIAVLPVFIARKVIKAVNFLS